MLNMPPSRICVIGGGFYGVVIALYLKCQRRFENVELFEREQCLLSRASFRNQARVHGGYHYPRSFTTAYRSRENFQRFCGDWQSCLKTDFQKYYALAKRNSKVSAIQFNRFCEQIGAPLVAAETEVIRLFNPALIEAVYSVNEYAFDATLLRRWAEQKLQAAGIKCFFLHTVLDARQDERGGIELLVRTGGGEVLVTNYSAVFNCTYSGLGQVESASSGSLRLKHEIAELAMVDPPEELKSIGITVMDGAYFSMMPFPAKNCHSLSHVRYTPHFHWLDRPHHSPYDVLQKADPQTRFDRMIRDAARYVPVIAKSRYQESLYEVKTVLEKNELDDGRPILFRESSSTRGLYSVLGGKIDNIYDILACIDDLLEQGG